jgi:hypothetical protein
MKSHHIYHTYKTKNSGCSVVAHFQNGAVTMLLAVLPIMDAKTTLMLNSDSITSQLPYLQDKKLLALH